MTAKRLDTAVRNASDQANARVTLLAVGTRGGAPFPYVRSDSTTQRQITDLQFQVAVDAVVTRHTTTGWESSNEGRVGEAARPLRFNKKLSHVIVFSAPLTDVQSNVALIRRQILVAGPDRARARAARRLRHRALADAARAPAGARGREGLARRLLRDDPDRLRRRARASSPWPSTTMQRQLAQLDSARKRFIAVGLARAAHAALLARRVRRAAPGRGARRGDAP